MSQTGAADTADPLSSINTLSVQEAKFWERWAIPEHRDIIKWFNATIMPWLAPGLELRGNYDEILSLISDTAERRAMLRADVAGGLMTVNRYRELTGEEVIETGNVLYVPSGVIVTQLSELGKEAVPPASPAVPALSPPSAQPLSIMSVNQVKGSNFDESEHPRDGDGQFDGDGSSNGGADDEEEDEGGEEGSEHEIIPKDTVRDQSAPPEDAFNRGEESAWNSGLNGEERTAMADWSDSNYNNYQAIAKGESPTDGNAKMQQRAVDRFDSFETAVDRAPQYDGVAWRGATDRNQNVDEVLADYQNRVGGTYTNDTYNSYSADAQMAGSFANQHASTGTPVMFETYSNQGRYTNSSSVWNNPGEIESELLMQPGTNFMITDAYIGEFRTTSGLLSRAVFVIMEDA